MKFDLLEAQAALDWPSSNLKEFSRRLEEWTDANISLDFKEVAGNEKDYLIVAEERETFPLIFGAEAGGYINSIRSSLDILACVLASRSGVTGDALKAVQFPFATTKAKFDKREFRGADIFNALPDKERKIIESLAPYADGNAELFALHDLDNKRKHRQLLAVGTNPASFRISGWGLKDRFTPIATGWAVNPGETMLGFIEKAHQREYQYSFKPYVGVNDPGPFARKEVISAISNLRDLAADVINRFDY